MNVTYLKLILPQYRTVNKPPIRGFYTRWEAYRRDWRHRVLEFSSEWRLFQAYRHDWTVSRVPRCGEPERIDCPVSFCPTSGKSIIAEMKREAADEYQSALVALKEYRHYADLHSRSGGSMTFYPDMIYWFNCLTQNPCGWQLLKNHNGGTPE